jgi:hypothetical protein
VYEADAAPSTLVCLSHLRWIFVYQRPQHLLSRAARTHKVILIEEPIFRTACEPLLDVCPDPSGVTVVTPVLRHGECIDKLLKVSFRRGAGRAACSLYSTPPGHCRINADPPAGAHPVPRMIQSLGRRRSTPREPRAASEGANIERCLAIKNTSLRGATEPPIRAAGGNTQGRVPPCRRRRIDHGTIWPTRWFAFGARTPARDLDDGQAGREHS